MTKHIDIYKFKSFYKELYRQEYATVEVEIVFGYIDYTAHPVIAEYEERGYRLHDSFTFGHGEDWGEILVFVKQQKK